MSAVSKRRRAWRRVAGLLFATAAFVFLGYFVAQNVGELREHEWSVRPGLLVASLLLNMAALGWGVRVWQVLLRIMAVRIGWLALARVWFVSGLGRYIPGKVWQFVGAAHLAGVAGIGGTVAVASLAVHTGFFMVGALLVGIYLVPAPVTDLAGIEVDVMRWFAPLVFLLVHPAVIGAGLRVVRRLSGVAAEWRGRWWDGARLVLLSSVGWVASGAAFYLFVLSLTPLPGTAVPGVIGVNALAFVAGYLVFIAPAGLGAKEGALTALLTIYLPAPVAAVVAIAARLWMVAAEAIPALLLLPRREEAQGPSEVAAVPEDRR